jgi:hypothetical protein
VAAIVLSYRELFLDANPFGRALDSYGIQGRRFYQLLEAK